MKITDVGWRSTIGGFRGIKFKSKSIILIPLSTILPTATIMMLLLIGGVELNPGPTEIVDFKDVNYEMVLEIKDRFKGLQKWQMIARTLTGGCSKSICSFMRQLDIIATTNNQTKHFSTTTNEVLIFLSCLEPDYKLNTNPHTVNSVWGKLAEDIYNNNDVSDRYFLSELWKIANDVEDLGPIRDLTPAKDRLLARKRYSDQGRLENRLSNSSNSSHSLPQDLETSSMTLDESTDRVINIIRDKFKRKVFNYLTEVCDICDMMIYNDVNHRRVREVTNEHVQLLLTVDHTFENHQTHWTLCLRCDSNLAKGKVPAKAKVNKMELLPVPDEIKCLSNAEVRLISQVRAYIKVYLLCGGRGQKGCKGMVVHFPTEVSEVVKQLPLTTVESDFIVIREKGSAEMAPVIRVEPRKVITALRWLVLHNPLYKDVVIREDANPTNMPSVVLSTLRSVSSAQYQENQRNMGYIDMGNQISILHGSFSQFNRELFGSNSGQQCTAMVASFIGHCVIQSPDLWTRQTLDGVLINGNDHYTDRRAQLLHDYAYLAVDEAVSEITVFDGAQVILTIDNLTPAITFVGYANRCVLQDLPRLDEVIRRFLDAGYRNGILTIGQFTVGIHVNDGFVYYFDSHNRGAKGGKIRSFDAEKGTACVLRYPFAIAHRTIASKANLNCIPTELSPTDSEHLRFTIYAGREQNSLDELHPLVQQLQSPGSSPMPKRPRLEEYGPDSDSEDIDDEPLFDDPIQASIPTFGDVGEGDCVIERDDPIAPDIEEVIQEYELDRPRLPPINSQYEDNLDLLGFPQLYPHGINGLHADRVVPITTLDYYQQRFMSSDPRFAGASEALFAALADCDKQRIKQKIGVCCAQTRQENRRGNIDQPERLERVPQEELLGVRNPHVYMSGIRGSSAYWKQYTGDLIAMVKSFGTPTFFFTFSYDDLNSEDSINALFKAKYGSNSANVCPSDLTFEERKELLNNYPVIAARHFSMRLSKFLSLISKHGLEIFGGELEDYSVRVEFQARGSPHAHMLLWLKDAPAWNTPEGIAYIERNMSCSLSTPHKNLVLRYQKHSHTKTCFKNKNSACRFGFEKPVAEYTRLLNEQEIVKNAGRFLVLKRTKEEGMIGFYHPILLPVLLCNMDIQVVTSSIGVAYYIAKYMSKAEPLEIRKDIRDSITSIQTSNLPAKQKMFKVAMTLMRNREISAQEAAFRLCHLYLRDSSRSTIFVPTFRKENRIRMAKKESLGKGELEYCTNIIERYEARPNSDIFNPICLAEFAANYELIPRSRYNEDVVSDEDLVEFPMLHEQVEPDVRPHYRCIDRLGKEVGRIRRRTRPAVLKHPNFHPVTDADNYYYSLLLLYLPFRIENFCDDGRSPVQTFEGSHNQFRTHQDDPSLRLELGEEIDRALLFITDFNDEDRDNVNLENEFQPPFEPVPENQLPPPLAEEVFPNDQVKSPQGYKRLKGLVRGLNSDQRRIFDTFHSAVKNNTRGIKQILLAPGGTGKTHLIKVMSMLIRQWLGHDALLLGAPTGKASFGIRGMTLHRLFQLPIQRGWQKPYSKLNDKRLSEFRQRYKNVKYIIIDEISMVSYETFRTIHLRLCEIFGTDGVEPFAGINLLVVGDLLQLPPVKACKIFKKPNIYSAEADLWRLFEFSELTINMRQGVDPLAQICSELRVGKLTKESLQLLVSRTLANLKITSNVYDDAIHIFPQNDDCRVHNNKKLRDLIKSGITVSTIHAFDTYADGPKQGRKVDINEIPKNEEDTGGIPTTIKLAIGAKVMLRSNINTKEGLCNGSTGYVTKIDWPINRAVQIGENQMPLRVWIRFDYDNIVRGIEPITIDFQAKYQQRVTRRMLPIILCWGCTIHKMQGVTVSKAVIDLSRKCNKKGMAYVALSRVKTLDGLFIKLLDVSKLLGNAPVDEEAMLEIERLRATLPSGDVNVNMGVENMEADDMDPDDMDPDDMDVDDMDADNRDNHDTNCHIM